MSATLTLTTLLTSLQSHLQTQTQLLPTLHAQLGLPPSALTDELTTLHQELTDCVERQIDARRREVSDWAEKCEESERHCLRLCKALGGHAKVVSGSVGELRKQQVLPKRHEFLLQYQDKLKQLYQTKLEQLSTLTNRLISLVHTLGSDFYTTELLEPTRAAGEDVEDPTALRDITPERFSKLEKELARGKNEITKRLTQLSETLVQIDWLYSELGIEPPSPDADANGLTELESNPSLLHIPQPFPRSISTSSISSTSDPFLSPTPAPRRSNAAPTENPTASYNRVFQLFMTRLDASSDGTIDLAGLEGIDPTPGLMSWAAQTAASLSELKGRREIHIQALYDQLEALWRRLGVPDKDMDAFIEAHRGSTSETVAEYELELERMLELKRERMEVFVGNAREEIERLWEELMAGDEERAQFTPFFDDEFSEDLLTRHEEEIKRLREERRTKAPLLASIRKYFQICDEEKELANAASDQSRLLGRGPRDPGRLLREEKMRKRVSKEKPRLEQDLLTSIPAWEEEAGRPFLVNGVSIVEVLSETVSAADKENKRKQLPRAGSVPPARATTPSYAPAPMQPSSRGKGTVTPAVRPGSSMAMQSGSNKRQRLGDSTSRPPLSSRGPGHGTNSSPPPTTHGKTPGSNGYSYGRSKTPTSSLPRPVPSKSQTQLRGYGGLGLGLSGAVREQPLAFNGGGSRQRVTSSRSRRESFKPRSSVDGGKDQVWTGPSERRGHERWAGFGGVTVKEEQFDDF